MKLRITEQVDYTFEVEKLPPELRAAILSDPDVGSGFLSLENDRRVEDYFCGLDNPRVAADQLAVAERDITVED